MPLTDVQARQAKPKEKTYKLSDSGGLYLEVTPKGRRYWRLKYRFNGKEKRLAIGVYPAVSLREARDARDTAKEQLAQGKDPSQQKQAEKLKQQISAKNTFEKVGRDWIDRKSHEWSKDHTDDVTRSLEVNIFPSIGHFPITDITAPMLTKVLTHVQNRGSLETAKRLRQRCSGIFRFGIAGGICEQDPAEYLKDVLKKPTSTNLAALSPGELPDYLKAIQSCNMTLQTRLAIRLMSLTFVRNTELREARWEEFDLDNATWIIPANRMKKKDQGDHIVPLSSQAIETI